MNVDSSILKTDVDDFIEMVKKTGKITINDAAKKLEIAESTVEAWAEFLVEEKILEMEYKFTTPYIFINTEDLNQSNNNENEFHSKKDFFKRATERKIPKYQAVILWVKYLTINKEKIRRLFEIKAKERGISKEKLSILWEKYYQDLMSE